MGPRPDLLNKSLEEERPGNFRFESTPLVTFIGLFPFILLLFSEVELFMMTVVAHALEYPFESLHLENRFLFFSAQMSLPLWSIQRYPLPLFFSATVYPIHPSFPL